jgi:elongation factor 1-beta
MAEVIVTFKIMPEGVGVDYEPIRAEAEKIIRLKGRLEKDELKPIAFGLKSLFLYAIFPESIGGEVEDLADKIGMVTGVDSCEVVDVRRAIEID